MVARPHLEVVVIGAGLAGLAAAISCAKSGHNVRIMESARELAEVGAGLQLTPNGTRILAGWGIGITELQAAVPTRLSVFRYDGQRLASEANFDQNIMRKYGAPFVDVHRVDLQKALVRKAEELGVIISTGHELVAVEQNGEGRAIAKVKNASQGSLQTYEADLVVGADGLWSATRDQLLKNEGHKGAEKHNPLPTGDIAYRIVLRADEIADSELKEFVSNPECNFWIGPGAHAVAYSLRNGMEMNIVLLVPDRMDPSKRREPGNVEEMRKLFVGWDPILTKFLECVETVDKWKLMHLSPLDNWTNRENNLILIGDSCHPMLPYLAQGANSSLEDGAVLGSILGHLSKEYTLSEAIKSYIELRKVRGETIARETFHQRQAFHMPDGPEQIARDEVFARCLEKGVNEKFPSRWTCPEVQPWLYGYDAEQAVASAVKNHT